MKTKTVIEEASFNPRIRTYFLLLVAFYVLISLVGIPFLVIWFAGLGQSISKKYYKSLTCRLTDRHLEFGKGVLFRVEKTIPLENIQDLTFLENPLLKWLGLRIVKVETAGQSNPQGSDMKLVGIVEAHDFKEKVLDQREEMLTRKYRSAGEEQQPGRSDDSETVALLREIRDLLAGMDKK